MAVDGVIDHILEKMVLQARANELEKCIDSYMANNTLENAAMVVLNSYQTKDESDDKYDYAADLIEPMPPGPDNNADTELKNAEDFREDNMVDVEFA